VGWLARGGRPGVGRKRRSTAAGGGESRVWAESRPSRGRRRLFSFFFLLSNSYFPFCIFSFGTNYFVDTLSV
jgi:hypothetical protein